MLHLPVTAIGGEASVEPRAFNLEAATTDIPPLDAHRVMGPNRGSREAAHGGAELNIAAIRGAESGQHGPYEMWRSIPMNIRHGQIKASTCDGSGAAAAQTFTSGRLTPVSGRAEPVLGASSRHFKHLRFHPAVLGILRFGGLVLIVKGNGHGATS